MDMHVRLNQLAQDLGMQELLLDAHGACGLAFGHGLQIDLHYNKDDDALHLAGMLGLIDSAAAPALMRALLDGNNDLAALGEGHFAIDRTHHEVVLCRTLVAHELRASPLSREVNRLVEACGHWRDELAQRGLIRLTTG